MKITKKIAICSPRRTPFAQVAKALGAHPSHHLGLMVAKDIFEKTGLKKEALDGVIAGEGFPGSPNPARVISSLMELPVDKPALTVCNNCVSSMDAMAEATRRILLGEGETYLVLGLESQTSMPFVVKNARIHKKSGSLEKLIKLLPDNLPAGVEIRDTLEDGLGDNETSYGMHITAELLAQQYEISRELSDKFAYESFKRAYEATTSGKYARHLMTIKDDSGKELSADEAVLLRKGIVENPGRMAKAMLLFDNPGMKFDEFKAKYGKYITKSHGPTVSIFNACPRSDGASGLILTTPEKAAELGLQVGGYLTGYAMKGVDPNLMGLGQSASSLQLLKEMDRKVEDMDYIEIHEAFAATAISALKEIEKQTGFDWEKKFDEKKINPNGGSIAIGHPFGATGIRLTANALMDLEDDSDAKSVMITSCAHGGIGGSLMIERAA